MGVVVGGLFREPKRRKHAEADLQRQVVAELEWRLPDHATLWCTRNEGQLHGRARAIWAGQGVVAGQPDLQVLWRGRMIFLELKTEAGRLSRAQRQRHETLLYCGAWVFVCRSMPEVEAALAEAGCVLKGSAA